MAKFAGMPWDLIMSADCSSITSPIPNLSRRRQAAAPAAAAGDDGGAHNTISRPRRNSIENAFVARPTEYGRCRNIDFEARGDWDIVAKDFGGNRRQDGV